MGVRRARRQPEYLDDAAEAAARSPSPTPVTEAAVQGAASAASAGLAASVASLPAAAAALQALAVAGPEGAEAAAGGEPGRPDAAAPTGGQGAEQRHPGGHRHLTPLMGWGDGPPREALMLEGCNIADSVC